MRTELGRHLRAAARAVVAATAAAGVLAAGALAAPGGGGAGSGSGAIGSGGEAEITWIYQEDFGEPTVQHVKDAMAQAHPGIYIGGDGVNNPDTSISQALGKAVPECQARGNKECRLVGVGFVHSIGQWNSFTGAAMGATTDEWQAPWGSSIATKTYSHLGVEYTTSDMFADGKTSVNSLVSRETADDPTHKSVIVVVLGENEPPQPPQEYELSIDTKASGVATAGGTQAVTDTIVLSNGGSEIVENVNGTGTLHWRGLDGTTRSVAKNFTVANNGKAVLAATPSDFGWSVWPAAAKYWWDVEVAKQGHMKQAASHKGENDPDESWSTAATPPVKWLTDASGNTVSAPNDQLASGSLYTAHIKAQSNGSQGFWLYDVIDVAQTQVWIGAADHDDFSGITVTDASGKTVAADISVDDSQAGKRIVKAHVTAPQVGEHTLNVPQAARPTDGDYTIRDDGKACWNGDGNHCQAGGSGEVGKVTPDPDKVWVVDENGALTAEDQDWSNDEGADNATFVPGDTIGAVVNGRIPAHLLNPFTSYEITDDWSGSAEWIDWNHPETVKVYVDGKDHTGDFDIVIDTERHTTTAKAKGGFLATTALGTKDRKVKLYVGGVIKSVAEPGTTIRLTNGGSETWNNETKPTNEPPVFVRTPKPDKTWSASQTDADQASDPEWTNTVNADAHTLVEGDAVHVTINGTLPKGLAADLTAWSLTDDWTDAARHIDLSDVSAARVTIDGKDRTGDFAISNDGTVITVAAKQSILKGSAKQANDRKVRVTLTGKVRTDTLEPGQTVTVTNKATETWNTTTIPSNEPPVDIRTPKPDKTWSASQTDADQASDPEWTNTVNADTHTLVEGDLAYVTINGTLPKGLAADLTAWSLTDDWSRSAKHIDFSDVSSARVTIDGEDRTGDFAISNDGTVITVAAKQSILKGSALQANDRKVRVTLTGKVRAGVLDPGQTVTVTNKATETWNGNSEESNEPPIVIRTPKPDKTWSGDQETAAGVQDPEWTNTVSADTHTFVENDTFAVTVNGTLPKDLAADLTAWQLGDEWDTDRVDLSDTSSIRVTIDGKDHTGDFDVHTENGRTWISAKESILKGSALQSDDRKVRMTMTGRFVADVADGDTITVTNGGFERWNTHEQPSNDPEVDLWSPNPDKSWILYEDGSWKAVIDPDETDATGADDHKFLDGDKVGAVVNGTLAADLVRLDSFVLTDDWGEADYLFDGPADSSKVHVYEAEASTDKESSVADIANKGKDVTRDFRIVVSGTTVTAAASEEWLKAHEGLDKPVQVTLLIEGEIDFDPNATLEDFGLEAGSELTFCTTPQGADLDNNGSQSVNDVTVDTNDPKICGYIPPVVKQVIAEGSEGGDQGDANGTTVFPGQKVEYRLRTTPQLPDQLAYAITDVTMTDAYDANLLPDKQTLEIEDLNDGDTIPKSEYKTSWDDENHAFTIVFDRDWVEANWRKGSNPRILLRFEGTVSEDAPADQKVGNEWALTLNNQVTWSNKVENLPPDITPGKQDTQKDPSISIDGKTALLGDVIYYRVTLDAAKLTDTAYKVWRLGMVDDYDDEYLRLDGDGVQILDETGADRTAEFNVADIDGALYAFARTADTYVEALGETIPGDPQPEDLKAYSQLTDDDHDPLRDPAIDQTLLGHTYTIVMPMTVIKVTDGYVVKNTATQITNDRRDETNTVSNPLKPINPSKDVTVQVGGDSANGHSIWLDRTFLYQLDSSILPADRAYPEITEWTITDPLDTTHDRYTGQWAVYAARDLHRDGQVIAAQGAMIAGVDFDPATLGLEEPLFTTDQAEDGTVTVRATQAYLDLVSADNEHENGFRAYIQCRRIATGDRIANTFRETINGQPRDSNEVWTTTPDMTPSISLEKWDEESGWPEGDRDRSEDALGMDEDTATIVFTITNTSSIDPDTGVGAWFQAKDLKIEDSTIVGDGRIEDWQYPENWDTLVLKPGDSVDVKATLKGVTDKHTDRASVSGIPLLPCAPDDADPFGTGTQDDGQCGQETDQPADGTGTDGTGTDGTGTDGTGTDGTGDTEPATDTENADDGTVEIDGSVLCADTPIVSATDDWNGYREQVLGETGSAVATIIGIMSLLLAGGSILLISRRGHAAAHKAAHGR